MQEERIIEFVRQNRFLYDKKHKDFKKHLKNQNKWSEIGEELNVSSETVKKRWRTIKDRYIRIKKQRKASMGINKAVKYRFAKMLTFLDDCNSSNESGHDDLNDEPSKIPEEFGEEFLESSDLQSNQSQRTSPNNLLIETSPSQAKNNKVLNAVPEDVFANSNNELVLSLLRTLKEECKPMTKERAFCESLAVQLEEANLPPECFRRFQIKVIQLLSDQISIAK